MNDKTINIENISNNKFINLIHENITEARELIVLEDVQKYINYNNSGEQGVIIGNPYKFLTNMPMSSITIENRIKLKKQYDNTLINIEEYRNKNILDMWLSELDELKNHINNTVNS